MGVVSAAGTFIQTLFGLGRAAVAAPTVTARVVSGVSRGAQAALPVARRALPFAVAGVGGAVVGGTLLDDVAPDIAMQLRERGIDPATFGRPRRPRVPELVFDPASGATFRRVKKRRRRGISATELRGFERVNDLLATVGRVPAPGRRKARRKSRRR